MLFADLFAQFEFTSDTTTVEPVVPKTSGNGRLRHLNDLDLASLVVVEL